MIVVIDTNNRLYLVQRVSPKPEQRMIYRNRQTGEIYTDLEVIGIDVTPRYANTDEPTVSPRSRVCLA